MDFVIAVIVFVSGCISVPLGRKGKNGTALCLAIATVLIALVVRHAFDGVSLALIASQGIGFLVGMAQDFRRKMETSGHVLEDVNNQLRYDNADNEPTVPLGGAR